VPSTFLVEATVVHSLKASTRKPIFIGTDTCVRDSPCCEVRQLVPCSGDCRLEKTMVMLEFLKHVLSGQNQFASGGLLLMVLGSVGVFLRGLPEQSMVVARSAEHDGRSPSRTMTIPSSG
jgi:hypothetical protein